MLCPLLPPFPLRRDGALAGRRVCMADREASSDLKEVAITLSKTKTETFAMVVALDEREREIMKTGGTLACLKGRA